MDGPTVVAGWERGLVDQRRGGAFGEYEGAGGDEADTTGAIDGQLAGAFHGEQGIPQQWRARLAQRELIESFAYRLLELRATIAGRAGGRPALPRDRVRRSDEFLPRSERARADGRGRRRGPARVGRSPTRGAEPATPRRILTARSPAASGR